MRENYLTDAVDKCTQKTCGVTFAIFEYRVQRTMNIALQQKDHNFTCTIAGITMTVTIETLRSCKAWPNKLVLLEISVHWSFEKNKHLRSFELWIIAISLGMGVVFILFLQPF